MTDPTRLDNFREKSYTSERCFSGEPLQVMLQPGASHKTAGKKKAKQNKMKANCSRIITRIITSQPLESHDPDPMGPYASTSILDYIFIHLVLETNPK